MDKRMKEDIVVDAYLQAYGKEKPATGLIIHTDQEVSIQDRCLEA